MAWMTPKTNWKATDTFEIEDYARIVGNITYLRDLAAKMFVVAGPIIVFGIIGGVSVGVVYFILYSAGLLL